ncbi:uncharacterized protein METZ01_LOCUS493905, partial [marine metagenome]
MLTGVAVADDYYEKGRSAYGSGQHEEAINWFRKSAEAGYDKGQYAYGLVLYANGQAPIEQKTEALKWFSLAGEQGNPSAQYMVGHFHENAEVVEQNYRTALEWYLKAANQGDLASSNAAGKIYDAVAAAMSDQTE